MTTETQKMTPCLWFDGQAEEAVNFYLSIFKNSRLLKVARYGEFGPGPQGSVMTISFVLDGQEYLALNGGPEFKFTPALSLIINCENQQEVDWFWEKLTADGGQEVQCGWLTDKYGLSWQVVPKQLLEVMTQAAPEVVDKVMQVMCPMKKLELEPLLLAARQ
jgi:predicted 3-demethylubiquinone-9 3-methyltransferase (glyoxalase superfamily)